MVTRLLFTAVSHPDFLTAMQLIGPYQLRNNLILAPMVGVSDTPFREICSQLGAGLTVGEMLTCNSALWHNARNRRKQIRPEINAPIVVQIAGSDPAMMAEAAILNAERGADGIDINMGCPAKKVLKKAAGSALLRDTALVESILKAVVAAVDIPVTLKIRTGWCPETRNGVVVARIAEDCGIRMLSVHGRTRADRFKGEAEYDTIAAIKQAVAIAVIANGDIDSAAKAAAVLEHTGADGLMIGRAAQGRPWIFQEIEHFLRTGRPMPALALAQREQIIIDHLHRLHRFYGEKVGVWNARKHVIGYLKPLPGARDCLAQFNRIESASGQLQHIHHYFDQLHQEEHDEGAIAA
jgi:tRNA-dihydrouridine synthase B